MRYMVWSLFYNYSNTGPLKVIHASSYKQIRYGYKKTVAVRYLTNSNDIKTNKYWTNKDMRTSKRELVESEGSCLVPDAIGSTTKVC